MSKWYEEAVFYHMYPLGLAGAPKYQESEETVHRFLELEKWIPHMAELGCTAVYIGPLFESSSHGYDTRDYKRVDRRLGSNEDFIRFVKECHDAGVRVVVDGVFNHTGREFFAFQDLKRNREASPYRDWYRDVNFGGDTGYHDGFWYSAWHNYFELPALNQWNGDVRQYLFDVIRFWIREFDIDGIRLDCADCLDFQFLREMREMTAREKEDFWLMGEVIHGDYARWTENGLLHSVTNYELHKGLYSGHNDHNYFEIAHTIRRQFDENGGIYRGRRLYSFVDNHDVDRLASKLHKPEHLKLVWSLMFTLPGIPSIYYGSEWGILGKKEGGNDDPLRPCLRLEDMEAQAPHPELISLIQRLGALKKTQPALTEGAYRELLLRNRQYAFARVLGDTAVVTAVNSDDQGAELVFACPVGTESVVEVLSGKGISIENGTVRVSLGANEGVVFVAGAGAARESSMRQAIETQTVDKAKTLSEPQGEPTCQATEPIRPAEEKPAQSPEPIKEKPVQSLEPAREEPTQSSKPIKEAPAPAPEFTKKQATPGSLERQRLRALSGSMYNDLTPELIAAREKAVLLANAYNESFGRPEEERRELLSRLLQSVGRNVHFEPVFRCEFGYNISIGNDFYASFDCIMLDAGGITIGDHVLFGPRVGIYTSNHAMDAGERAAGACYARPVRIGNHVWIGAGVHINPGVTIGDNVVIGSGSVVTKDIPANVMAAGVPCRVIREITEADKTGYSVFN